MDDRSYLTKRLIIARRKRAYLERVRERSADPVQLAEVEAELTWMQGVISDLERRSGPNAGSS
jgi:hypothetical protein